MERMKDALNVVGLRQRTLEDETGKRIPASARWIGERRTPEEQEAERAQYNRRYDNVRRRAAIGNTNALSAKESVQPVRSPTVAIGTNAAFPGNNIRADRRGGPAAVAAARWNLERGEAYEAAERRGPISNTNQTWSEFHNRQVKGTTGGPNPMLEQIQDAGKKRRENSRVARVYGRKNKDMRQTIHQSGIPLGPARLLANTAVPNVNESTRVGLGAPSRSEIINLRNRQQRFKNEKKSKKRGETKKGGRRARKRKSRRKRRSRKMKGGACGCASSSLIGGRRRKSRRKSRRRSRKSRSRR